MALNTALSGALSGVFSLLLFALMQLYKNVFNSSEIRTIIGGFLASILFVLLLTSISNFGSLILGRSYQARFFPEVAIALGLALFSAGLVHRVCLTTCFIFSMLDLYYVNKISLSEYATPIAVSEKSTKYKKRN